MPAVMAKRRICGVPWQPSLRCRQAPLRGRYQKVSTGMCVLASHCAIRPILAATFAQAAIMGDRRTWSGAAELLAPSWRSPFGRFRCAPPSMASQSNGAFLRRRQFSVSPRTNNKNGPQGPAVAESQAKDGRSGVGRPTNVGAREKFRGAAIMDDRKNMVGAAGFEPTTPCPPGRCATRLRYAPTEPTIIADRKASRTVRPWTAVLVLASQRRWAPPNNQRCSDQG